MPSARQRSTSHAGTLFLSPPTNPPPWKKTTTGAGPEWPGGCGAFQRSRAFRVNGP